MRSLRAYHKAVSTTELLGSASLESRRRTKGGLHSFTEQELGCLHLGFSALWQTGERWRPVMMTEWDLQQLAMMGRELVCNPILSRTCSVPVSSSPDPYA